MDSQKGVVALCGMSFLTLILIIWAIISATQINETERGVMKRGGKIVEILQPGFNFSAFPLYTVDVLSVQQDTNKFSDVTSKTFDEQVVTSDISVTYKLKSDDESISNFYRNFHNMENFLDKILRRNITNQLQIVMGKYSIQDTVRKKEQLDLDYLTYMQRSLKDTPVEILSVQVESIKPSARYVQMIEQRMQAEVESKTREQNLETEKFNADIVRTQAQAQADKEMIQKRAQADGILAVGEAEAKSLEIMNKALFSGGNPDKIIEYTKVLKWDGGSAKIITSGATGLFSMDSFAPNK